MKKQLESIWNEIRAIVWPSRKRVYNDTLIVVASLVIGGVFIAIIDYGLGKLVSFAIEKISGA